MCRLQRAVVATLVANACMRTAARPAAPGRGSQGLHPDVAMGSLESQPELAAPEPSGWEQGAAGPARMVLGPGRGAAQELWCLERAAAEAPLDTSGSEALGMRTCAACGPSPAPSPSALSAQRGGGLADQGSRSTARDPGPARFSGPRNPELSSRAVEPGAGRAASGPCCEVSVGAAFAAWQALTVQQWRARGAVAAPMMRLQQWR